MGLRGIKVWVTILIANNTKCVNDRAYIRLVGTKVSIIVISGFCGYGGSDVSEVGTLINESFPCCRYSVHSHRKLSGVFGGRGVSSIVRFTNLGTINRDIRGPLRCFSGGVSNALILLSIVEGGNYGGVIFSSSTAICKAGGVSPLARSVRVNNMAGPCNEAGCVVRYVLRSLCISSGS